MIQSTILQKAIGFARSMSIRSIVGAFALKGFTVALLFLLISLATRVLGEHDFGMFSILFSAGGLFAVFATAGQQVLVMRTWNEYSAANDAPRLKGALYFSLATVTIGTMLVGSTFYFVLSFFFPLKLAAAAALYLCFFGASLVSSHLVRTAIGVGRGDGIGNLGPITLPILYLIMSAATGHNADIATLLLLFATGAASAVIIHTVLIFNNIRARFPEFSAVKALYDTPTWKLRSLKLWISNGLEASNQYLDVLIIGFLMSPTVAGAYFVTTRLANIFAIATDALHWFSSRHIPDLYYRKDFKGLDAMLNTVAIVTLLVVSGGLIAMTAVGYWLLMIFSPTYTPYYGALLVLCIGTAAVSAAGPSGSILMFTGHEGRTLKILASTVALRVAGFFALIPMFEVMGAVSATTISFLFMAIMLRLSAKKLTGIDGSIARLLPGVNGTPTKLPAE